MSQSLLSVVKREDGNGDVAPGLGLPLPALPTRPVGGDVAGEVRRLRAELVDALVAVAERLEAVEHAVRLDRSQAPASLLKVAEVAKRLGVSTSTVYNNLIYPRVLPSCRLPVPGSKRSAIRVESAVLERFIGSLANADTLAAFAEWAREYQGRAFEGAE